MIDRQVEATFEALRFKTAPEIEEEGRKAFQHHKLITGSLPGTGLFRNNAGKVFDLSAWAGRKGSRADASLRIHFQISQRTEESAVLRGFSRATREGNHAGLLGGCRSHTSCPR